MRNRRQSHRTSQRTRLRTRGRPKLVALQCVPGVRRTTCLRAVASCVVTRGWQLRRIEGFDVRAKTAHANRHLLAIGLGRTVTCPVMEESSQWLASDPAVHEHHILGGCECLTALILTGGGPTESGRKLPFTTQPRAPSPKPSYSINASSSFSRESLHSQTPLASSEHLDVLADDHEAMTCDSPDALPHRV